jgi:Na+/melibiose symporter-like transporter
MLLGQIILWLAVINNHSLVLFMVGWLVGFLASGAAMAMPFSLLPNAVDYGEWKTGVRAAGLLAAIGAAFCLKAGAGIGGALPMWILGAAGFVADREQSPDALWAIESSVVWLPAIFIALSAIPVLFYKKFEQLEPQIRAELEQRRARTTNVHSI